MADTAIRGRIVDVEDATRQIHFYSFDPPSNSVAVNYEHQGVRGRSSPYRFYSDSGPETWDFSIDLRGSVDAADDRTNRDVWNEHLFIKSFAFPDYGRNKQGPVRPPRLAYIEWGSSIRLVGAILSPRFSWSPPFDAAGYPHGISCSFALEVDSVNAPLSFSEVERGVR